MSRKPDLWQDPESCLRGVMPDRPVLFFAPSVLQSVSRRFRVGFPGVVTYAVKANDAREVIGNLRASGITAFDVASPFEMARVREIAPDAVLHYNNPVRSRAEIAAGVAHGVASWSVDAPGELAKLAADLPRDVEIAVRLKLDVPGGAYDFGSKFGADPVTAVGLLREVARLGFRPAMTFHPGTQCTDPAAWVAYMRCAAEVAQEAGVRLGRLNVGGGFAARRNGAAPDLEAVFAAIAGARAAFGAEPPGLVCEPGRAMVADAFALAARVKSLREDGAVFLNDGIYGGLSEAPVMGVTDRIRAIGPRGDRAGPATPRVVFGPTCDSLDRLPGLVPLPADLAEGDYLVFGGMGAYSTATTTRFNGYGSIATQTVLSL